MGGTGFAGRLLHYGAAFVLVGVPLLFLGKLPFFLPVLVSGLLLFAALHKIAAMSHRAGSNSRDERRNNIDERRSNVFVWSVLKFAVLYAVVVSAVAILRTLAPIPLLVGIAFILVCIVSSRWVFNAEQMPHVFGHPLFLAALVVKLIVATVFASQYLTGGVLPLTQLFASTLANPYDAFMGTATLSTAYPLSPVLLGILALPMTLAGTNIFANLLALKLPLLAADIGVLLILCKLLPNKERDVLLFYWCSPIVLYITYFQGQLDIIIVLLLMAAVWLITTGRIFAGMFVLGIGTATKANVLVALPFVFLYLWRKHQPFTRLVAYLAVVVAVTFAFYYPLAGSAGFSSMLSMARNEMLDLALGGQVALGTGLLGTGVFGEAVVYFVPLLLAVFALRISYYRIMSRDVLLMALAIAFLGLALLTPSRPAWYVWSLPFIIYFFLRNDGISTKHLHLYTAAFILYFIVLSSGSDFFSLFAVISPSIASLPTMHSMLDRLFDASLLSGLAFTALVGTVLIDGIWVYQYGLIDRFKRMRAFFIGVCGDSGAGKSTVNALIIESLGSHNVTVLEGDDMHKWARGDANWERYTHLDPRANRLHQDMHDIAAIGTKRVLRSHYDHTTGQFTAPKHVDPSKFVIVSGLHTFYLEGVRKRLQLKVFLDTSPQLLLHWKVQRDVGQRGYTKERVRAQLAKRRADSKVHIAPQHAFADVRICFASATPLSDAKIWNVYYEPELAVSMWLRNDIDIEPVVAKLSEHRGLVVRHRFDSDGQTLSVRGRIGEAELASIAHVTLPDIDALTEDATLRFKNGLNGVLQLVLLRCISERTRIAQEEVV